MEFFASAITTLQTLVVALGAGLGVWGVVNLLEGYGSDNPGSKSQGMKQLMAGGGRRLQHGRGKADCPRRGPASKADPGADGKRGKGGRKGKRHPARPGKGQGGQG